MIVGIDASNIRAGGGLTHLSRLLEALAPGMIGHIEHVIVWGGQRTIDRLQQCGRVDLIHVPVLDRSLPLRMAWQRWALPDCLRKQKCNVLFSPGGILPGHSPVPTIVMSQNLLPFEPQEASRFPFLSFMRLKMRLVGCQQRRSMKQADGLVFLTQYARDTVLSVLNLKHRNTVVVPHGVEERFFYEPRADRLQDTITTDISQFHILYVSIVDVYKHQCQVAEAVASLRSQGVPVQIDFVGPAYGPALKRLASVMEKWDPKGEFLHYLGAISFAELHTAYRDADAFVFASSCENLPNILLEAMASGLPIACSNKGPMPEVLGDAGIYFDPENVTEIETAISDLFNDSDLRSRLAKLSFEKAKAYSWQRCAHETFSFIAETIQKRR